MNTILFWYRNSRPTALPQSVIPSVLAFCIACSTANFSWWLGVLAVLGVMFAHLGLNLFDDYFDYRKKQSTYRDTLVHEGFRARISKCAYLTSGQATVAQLLKVCIIFCSISVIIGAVIFYFRGMTIFYIAVITAFLGFFYSAPPFRFSYHGFGELIIGIIFGLLNMLGTYYAAAGTMDTSIMFISVPVGLLVMNIVYVHSILDFIPDKKIGKRTLAVLLNNTKAMLVLLFFIIFAPFAIIVYGIITGFLSPYYWAVFLSFPMAISLFYLMIAFVKDPQRKFTPRFWMGPMNQWKRITEVGIDWFMIRWLSARNLLTLFCLIIMAISFIK